MKTYRKELWFNIPKRRDYVNITPQVEECIKESGIREGIVLCNAMHISASVFINDDERGLHKDFDFLTSNTLGMKLVHLLSSQIGGRIQFESNGGTRYVMKFNEVKYKERTNEEETAPQS